MNKVDPIAVMVIHDKASNISNSVSNVNSTLNGHINEALIFAAAVYKVNADAVAHGENDTLLNEAKITRYQNAFNARFAEINATLEKLGPLLAVQQGKLSRADYVSSVNKSQLTDYIESFDGNI
jgi:hypothetical protein